MKKITAFLLCLVLLLGLTACFQVKDDPDDVSDPSDGVQTPPDYRVSEFEENLIAYLCLNGYDSANFVISPAAFRGALSLAAAGAQGNTRTELVRAAGFSGIESFRAWNLRQKKNEAFSLATSVWNNRDLIGDFTNSYAGAVKTDYAAESYACKSDALTQQVNDWIAQKTQGRISAVAEDMAGASTALVGVLDLQAAWKSAFSKASAHKGTMTDSSGKEFAVEFMEQTGNYLYTEENGTQIVVIPMEGNLSFVCFLGGRMGMFEKLSGLHTETVHVVLPKFSLSSDFNATELSGFLLSQGVYDAIDERSANFYNMCQGTDWFIQEILLPSRVTVDENGVGAASKAGAPGGKENGQVMEFIADSPFAFGIFSDFGTGLQSMLFYGQLMNGD